MDSTLNAHAKPPDHIRQIYKKYQTLKALSAEQDIFDSHQGRTAGWTISQSARKELLLPDELQHIVASFLDSHPEPNETEERGVVYEHPDAPGLFVFPSLLPSQAQLHLLDKLLNRDLSNPKHMTNLHMHYDVLYPTSRPGKPASFFEADADSITFEPKDPAVHKPLPLAAALEKKLRWMTLGGQYDWTQKRYPSEQPPPFPADIAALIQGLFPAMKAQAAIVNLYRPGDTLSLHRDVSEECNRPLASISIGCDALFVVGLGDDAQGLRQHRAVTIRLRSGDAVVMSGQARTAWHSVPQVIAGTCPELMRDWPCIEQAGQDTSRQEDYTRWRGWMANKRINLNVRQMWDEDDA